ncbi:hypothetical protein CABS01_11637 [Colletotrichum abscissum]|uniref:uncharacterized protein n=1 Tax=Colletotrichum abscissum TaxID=1671311 RepID=UPI0027D54812|nr:uncharacterized protein CABS01_11637 [Colletotrichum abscissum]KAK1493468.1 hypothetical protein CABS01_11637 [Colletotrichum abscissum]
MHPYLHSAFLYLLARLRGEALHGIAGFTRAGIAFLRDASGHELESSGRRPGHTPVCDIPPSLPHRAACNRIGGRTALSHPT